jgi:hypothetical protein
LVTQHHPFNDLIKGFSEARKARVAVRASELKTEIALTEQSQARELSTFAANEQGAPDGAPDKKLS